MCDNFVSSRLVGGLAVSLWLSGAHADPTVSVQPAQVRAQPGDVISTALVLSSASGIDGGGVIVRYDPRTLRLRSVQIDESKWSFANRVTKSKRGSVGLIEILVTTFGELSGDVNVATIEFGAAGAGTSRVQLSESITNPFASGGKRVEVTLRNAGVQIRRDRGARNTGREAR